MSRFQLLRRSVLALLGVVATAVVFTHAWAADAPPPGFPAGDPPAGFPAGGPPPGLPPGMFGPPPSGPPVKPKAGALIDLTGNWVAIVNEDWRFRMATPPKGDFEGLILSPAAMKQASTWTPTMDGSCKAYGVAGLMRMPTRLKISWEGDDVLKIETDAGMQTRRLLFTSAPASGPKTLQGYSMAEWQKLVPPLPPNPFLHSPPATGGTLKVTTTNHTAGWLRKNGAPYSENASILEYFDRWPGPDGSEWLSVTTAVDDPVNLFQPYYTSSHFRKEPNASKWRPKPCTPVTD